MSRNLTIHAELFLIVVATCVLTCGAQSQDAPHDPLERIPPILLSADKDLLALQRAAASEAESGNFETAHAKLQQAFELAKSRGSQEDTAKIEGALSNAESALGNVDVARKLNDEAQALASKTDNLALQAELLIDEAQFMRSFGRNKDAEKTLVEAVSKARASN